MAKTIKKKEKRIVETKQEGMQEKRQGKKLELKKHAPIGVKIIAILGIIINAMIILAGIAMIIAGIVLSANPVTITFPAEIPAEIATMINSAIVPFLIIAGVICIILPLIGLWISISLMRLKNWARIVVIVLAILGALSSFMWLLRGDFSQIVNLAVNVIIGAYLFFSENVKKAFAS